MGGKNTGHEMKKPRGRPKKTMTKVYEFDEDYVPKSPTTIVVTKPSISRYPIRHFRRTDNQCNGSIPFNEDAAAVQHQNFCQASDSSKNCTQNLRRSRSPESENWSRLNMERLTSKYPSMFPSSAGFVSNNLPTKEADVARNVTSGCAERTSIPHAETECTFTLTEVADEMDSHLLDDDYIGQFMDDPTLVNVEGYYVRQEVAALFQQIIRKHTGIGTNCAVKCGTTRGLFAEMICSVYKKLEKTCLMDITAVELDGMFAIVNILENQKIDVTWLHERLKDISSMKHLVKEYRSLKKEETRKAEAIARKEKEVSSAEAELVVMKAELNKVRETKCLMRKNRTVWGKSLVQGLL